jgi:hypothetical protein
MEPQKIVKDFFSILHGQKYGFHPILGGDVNPTSFCQKIPGHTAASAMRIRRRYFECLASGLPADGGQAGKLMAGDHMANLCQFVPILSLPCFLPECLLCCLRLCLC